MYKNTNPNKNNDSMHIGFLTPEYVLPKKYEGGLANYINKVSKLLHSRGHRVSIFVLSDRNANWNEEFINIHEIRTFNFPNKFYKLPFLWRFLHTFSQIWSAKRIEKKVYEVNNTSRLHIIQTSSYRTPGITLLSNKKIPIVCRISSYTPLVRSAYGFRRNFSDYLRDWLEIRQVIGADSAFSPSVFIANVFERIEGYKPNIIRTPLDLISLDALDRSIYEKYVKDFEYLLFLGTLSRVKGADLFGETLPVLFSKNLKLHVVLIGRDDGLPSGRKIFDYIKNLCVGYLDRIHYFPPLPKLQLLPIIQNAIGVVMPSRVDNYPNACLEAQMLGTPVVGTLNSSLDEIITDGKTGFLARNNDLLSLYAAIDDLLRLNPDQLREMKANINQRINEIESEDRIGQLVDFYKETIARFLS